MTARDPPSEPTGINVIGHVSANMGVGVVTRQLIELLEERGHPLAVFDVERGKRRESHDPRYDRLAFASADLLPHRINLFVLGLGAIDWALGMCPERFFDGTCVNAVVCFWELPVAPRARLAQLDGFDVVIAASDYMHDTFLRMLEKAVVIRATLPVLIPAVVPFDRAALGVPAGDTLFGFSFDPASDLQRKNPVAVITSFIQGVGPDPHAWLVIRVNNALDANGSPLDAVIVLRQVADNHPRILFVTQALSFTEVLGLYRACDAYVSLHRAEGLGLGMAEAMTMGVPVIATAWSGNMTYMRHANSCLVDYRLVPVRATHPAYGEEDLGRIAQWAEPDVRHAAAWMVYLVTDVRARGAIGRAASASMNVFNAVAREARFIDELLAYVHQRSALEAIGFRRSTKPGRPLLPDTPVPMMQRIAGKTKGLVGKLRRKATSKLHRSLGPKRI